ncbi:UDP-N-acetylmuramoyl-L-alanine--D-glutamate ligase [Hydrogenophaga sp. PBL-H3]|uniref:UDP-N-acetylmuramoyl-L-alanine--D-glutamate ligase n=1 Tax=Hydrogenophaga sp. PBL-H3 TaxID=434010 RepID=UPI00131FB878|nr:UDP-N-acetylmuramoyl-L-alanine--D-glutamate ligase [Hydrogenophaga sp. PBL-H3]QHE75246.1 UDP-N-acetylmuramoyl-L-alanine--D-glutamate ligase [Hydrogenophaga sp. PBL-H3]QHE79673.1 UDP-N-acetylmuramoyl-L-alanine--D-glutamate ligase [Hydrogenophaga sp. PBL-H3]
MHDQHVLILGLGASGLAMARWCARQGANVTVADTREQPPQLGALQAECPQASFVSGAFDETLMARGGWTLIARSPGLAPASLEAVFGWAQAHGVAVLGELGLFARALKSLAERERLPYKPRVLAITGTNGKTTVTSLTTLLLRRAGVSVAMAGNIGPTLLDVLSAALDTEAVAQQADDERAAAEALAEAPVAVAPVADAGMDVVQASEPADEDAPVPAAEADEDGPAMLVPPPVQAPQPAHLPRVWVLELSSFQLDGAAGGEWDLVPTAASVLNITEDHLDWHGSMAAYTQAKAAVFGAQALMLLNRDDPQVMALQPRLVTVKVGNRNRQQSARPWASFGLDTPTRAGDWGIESLNGMAWLVRALALDETRKRARASDEAEEIYFQRLMPVDALRIRGRHNAANALAALALATSTGAALGPMLHGLREYRGEPHRVEPVAIIDEVEYFDDSKGTNVGATLAAVNGLGAERRLVVILGGDGKGQDFAPLAAPLARSARAVVYIGRDAGRIRAAVGDALEQAQVPQVDATTLAEAVTLAAQQARSGDAVLMSPACASLDMFDNYEHRARVFVDAVGALATERGMSLEGGL